MKRRERKGFTIVELVIVIAIVAVLAAVLIPTFASLIDKANQSADIQAAKQLSDALAMGSVEEKPQSLEDVFRILLENGFDLEKYIQPTSKNYRFFWYNDNGANIIILAEIPQFFDDALTPLSLEIIYDGNKPDLPEKFKAKVIFPPDSGVEGSVANEFEKNLNRLIELLWKSSAVDSDGNFIGNPAEIMNYLTSQIGDDAALKAIFDTIFKNDFALGEKYVGEDAEELPNTTIRLNSISLTPNEITLDIGGTQKLEVVYNPVDTTVDKTVKWFTSNQTVAAVDNGVVTAVGHGTATITAMSNVDNSIIATCQVTVAAIPVTGVQVTEKIVYLNQYAEHVMFCTVNPEVATNKEVTWSLVEGENIVTVDSNGKITAKNCGVATVKVTTEDGSFSDTATVVVYSINIETPASIPEIKVGSTHKIPLTVNDGSDDDIYKPEITYTTTSGSVTVSKDGTVTGLKYGTAEITITVTYAGMTKYQGTYTIKVLSEVGRVQFKLPEKTFGYHDEKYYIYTNTDNITVTATDVKENGNVVEVECNWASSDNVSIVGSTTGKTVTFKTTATGEAWLKASVDDEEYEFKFVVIRPITRDDVTITLDKSTIVVNEKIGAVYTINNSNVMVVDDTWSVVGGDNDFVVEGNNDGEFIGKKVTTGENGMGIVVEIVDVMGTRVNQTATIKVVSAIQSVEITEIPTLAVGTTNISCVDREVLYNVTYTNGTNDTEASLVWKSSDENIVTVDRATGKLTAVAYGTADIIIEASDNPDRPLHTFTVTVYAIELNYEEIYINVDPETYHPYLEVYVYPSSESNNEGFSTTWEKVGKNQVNVASAGGYKGKLQAQKECDQEIKVTVTIGDVKLYDTCIVRASNVSIKYSESGTSYSTMTGNSFTTNKLNSTIWLQAFHKNGSLPAAKWTLLNTDIATVDETTGTVSTQKYGTATIKVTSTQENIKLEYIFTLEVEAIPVESVTIPAEAITLLTGKSVTLSAIVEPAEADQKVTWSVTSGTDVVSVDANGTVTALKTGTAKVTAKSVSDETKLATCTITVKDTLTAPTDLPITNGVLAEGTHTINFDSSNVWNPGGDLVIGDGTTLTINLNNNKLSTNVGFKLVDGGKLVVNGGEITTSASLPINVTEGILELNGVKLTMSNTDLGIQNHTNGTVIINDCTIAPNGTSTLYPVSNSEGGTMTINNTSIIATFLHIVIQNSNEGTLILENVKIENAKHIQIFANGANVKTTIRGGSYTTLSSYGDISKIQATGGAEIVLDNPTINPMAFDSPDDFISASENGVVTGTVTIKSTLYTVDTRFIMEGTVLTGYTGTDTNVVIPSGVTSIAANAFAGNETITSVTIDGNVTSIGDNAFKGCINLTEVYIGTGVKNIGTNVFTGCKAINTITIPECGVGTSIPVFGYLFGATEGTNNWYSSNANCATLKDMVFEKVTILEGTTKIGDHAFKDCWVCKIYELEIPKSVTTLGLYAVADLQNLRKTPDISNVTSIGKFAFRNWKFSELTISDKVTEIGHGAFQNCKNLNTLTVPFIGSASSEVQALEWLFYKISDTNANGVTTYYMPQNLTVKVKTNNYSENSFDAWDSNVKTVTTSGDETIVVISKVY